MSFLSVLYSIPIYYLLLVLVVFVLLLVEIILIIRKKNKTAATGTSWPLSPGTINTTTQTFAVATPPKKSHLKYIILVVILGFVGVVALVASLFLRKPQPVQELRGRAEGNVSVASWNSNCGGSNAHPTDPSCKGSIAWVEVNLKNNSGSDQNVTVRKQQFSCDTGVQGTSSCGKNAQDQTYTVTVPANAQSFPLGRLQSATPNSSCGSAQVDYFINGDNSTPYWGFAWTGSDCSVPPTHPPNPTNTPIPPSPTPTVFQPTATATPPVPSATPPQATATEVPSGMCVQINFYTDLTFGTKLSLNDLPNLAPGSNLVMTVLGNSNSDMARVRVNGSGWQSLSQRRSPPNDNEFYDPNQNDIYQIPAGGVTTFTVEGQVHDANGWH